MVVHANTAEEYARNDTRSTMNLSATLTEITSLSVDERLHLVEAIWDSITAESGQPALTDAQEQELARRLAAHTEKLDAVIPWEEVRAEALARIRR